MKDQQKHMDLIEVIRSNGNVNFNSLLVTIVLAVLAYFGQRIVSSQDELAKTQNLTNTAIAVISIKVEQHDKDIQTLQQRISHLFGLNNHAAQQQIENTKDTKDTKDGN